jgi:hypothetical protein
MKKISILLSLIVSVYTQTATEPNGDGTSNDPFIISNINELYWVSQNSDSWNKDFKQTANINASETKIWNDGQGFTPIGNNNNYFSGKYDGGGFKIDSLHINATDSYKGLFGYLYQADLDSIGLTNVNIYGFHYIGALAGYARTKSTITNCYSTGKIQGYWGVGGLVGILDFEEKVEYCYSTVDVIGTVRAGGLVGGNSTRSRISYSYSRGNVTGSDNTFGNTSNNVFNDQIGGLVGMNFNNGMITDCYSTGEVKGTSNVGGLVGKTAYGSWASQSFWDYELSKIDSSKGGTKKSTAEMKAYKTFKDAGWNFGTYWDMDNTVGIYNDGFPFLTWQNNNQTLINYPPILSAGDDITMDEDSYHARGFGISDTENDNIIFSAKSDTNAVTLSITKPFESYILKMTPNANWHGVANISLYASDEFSTDSSSLKLTVTPVNDAPVISAIPDDSTNEETEKAIVVGASDVEGDALTYTASSDTSAVGLTISSDTLKLTPATNYTGTAKITVIVADNALTDTTSFNFKVININDSPVISTISDVTTNEDTAKTVTLSATDVDGDALTYTGKSNTEKVIISISSTTMTLTPATNWYGTAIITAYVSDGTVKDSTSFKLTVTTVNDAPVITAVSNDSTDEEIEKAIKLSASDIEGDALTYSASSDTSAVGLTISSDTLKLNPALNYTGTAKITVIVSDNTLKDTTSFTFKVINVNDAPVMTAVANDTTSEDSDGKTLKLSASDIDGDALTYTAFSDTTGLTVTVSNDTLRLKPVADYYGTSSVKAFVSDGQLTDSTAFSFTVLNVQDAPYAFDWVSTALDTIDISQSNLADTYELKWSESKDVDGETIDYLLYVKIGVLEPEEIYDTTSTSVPITYQEFLDNVFEPFPMLPRVTVKFSVSATDGIDTVKITGDNRVLFVNRYEYLSTESEGIPTEFALHENYPNPFNPTTTLRFDLPEVSDITLTIYNMLGQKVRTFNYQNTSAGYHSVTWDATNDLGQQVGAGVYLYQLLAKDFVKTRKMVLLK